MTARDGGVPSLSDTTDVEISVVDVNDNEPVFKQQLYTASIVEDALVGESLASSIALCTRFLAKFRQESFFKQENNEFNNFSILTVLKKFVYKRKYKNEAFIFSI